MRVRLRVRRPVLALAFLFAAVRSARRTGGFALGGVPPAARRALFALYLVAG
jgi:hypothetical protein